MLNQETKKKIDSARDILVGKVPDPKAQVEQITTALIYKFMDDMDKQAASLPKGKPQFFTNGFEKYAWSKMMDAKLGGQERLNLYVEAIAKMAKNPHLPQLFRDVFKDAFLPYRDPETLNLFLKDINTFSYDHSENLGDAFEYLLSILGSQGDAGQFRTPRHIIDFRVEVVAPKKDETILDPACGTAGFLISAYKHILKSNKNKPLTPDEKKRLMGNLAGYDISPDMVKLSLVNMYLHGFPNPNIHEYDTLSSEEKWDERFDVMMANPPFMSPKGGIRPHKRFMVQANRSEVLFVGYILEHLNNRGRAGIIVPEGIVDRPENAYRDLRKLLVEDGLYAVVSLPAGVFNPYSGVKSSILFFDNQLAKQSKEILFVKVLNDGFDLGANRREIEKSDLPNAIELLKAQREAVETGKVNVLLKTSAFALVVSKAKIKQDDDYNLSGERYKEVEFKLNKNWEVVEIGDVCDFKGGSQPPKSKFIHEQRRGYIKFIQIRDFGANGVETYIPIATKNRLCEEGDVLIARYGASLGRICTGLKGAYNVALLKAVPNKKKILTKYLFYLLSSDYIQKKIQQFGARAAQAGIRPDDLKRVKIALLPISEQERLVREIDEEKLRIQQLKDEVERQEQKIKSKIAEVWGE